MCPTEPHLPGSLFGQGVLPSPRLAAVSDLSHGSSLSRAPRCYPRKHAAQRTCKAPSEGHLDMTALGRKVKRFRVSRCPCGGARNIHLLMLDRQAEALIHCAGARLIPLSVRCQAGFVRSRTHFSRADQQHLGLSRSTRPQNWHSGPDGAAGDTIGAPPAFSFVLILPMPRAPVLGFPDSARCP